MVQTLLEQPLVTELEAACERLGARWYLLTIDDEERGRSTHTNLTTRLADAWLTRWHAEDPLFKYVSAEMSPVHNLQLFSEQAWSELPIYLDFLRQFNARHCLAAPLHGAAGPVLGVLNIYASQKREAFEVSQLLWVASLGGYLAGLLSRSDLQSTRGGMTLARRELEVARLAALGRDNPQIAQQLGISRETVKKTLARVYSKLDVSGRASMATLLTRSGLL